MGTLTIACLIKNHADRKKTVRIPRLTVDAGSDATWIARKHLEQIEIKTEKRQAYQLANGQYVDRDVGYAIVCVGQRKTADEVVFAEKGDRRVLGPRSLSGLMLWVDPTNKKLIEIKAHPVAARPAATKEILPRISRIARIRKDAFSIRAIREIRGKKSSQKWSILTNSRAENRRGK